MIDDQKEALFAKIMAQHRKERNLEDDEPIFVEENPLTGIIFVSARLGTTENNPNWQQIGEYIWKNNGKSLLRIRYNVSQITSVPHSHLNGIALGEENGDSYDEALQKIRDVPGGILGTVAMTITKIFTTQGVP